MSNECEKCNQPLDDSSEVLCTNCSDENAMTPSQASKQATQCPCEEGPPTKQSLMQCTNCTRWWHPECVGLAGLTKYSTSSIKTWNCPLCFKLSSELREKLKVVEEIESSEIKNEVRKEVAACIPDMLKKVEQSITTALADFKIESKEVLAKSWADVAKGDHKQLINEVVEQSSKSALKQSIRLIDSNLTEQRNRSNNIIITNIKEEREEDVSNLVYGVLEPVVDIPRSDIVKAVRLGKPATGRNRMILVTLRHEEDAKFLHNYKYGRKVELNVGSGYLWINADLTKTERDAAKTP